MVLHFVNVLQSTHKNIIQNSIAQYDNTAEFKITVEY